MANNDFRELINNARVEPTMLEEYKKINRVSSYQEYRQINSEIEASSRTSGNLQKLYENKLKELNSLNGAVNEELETELEFLEEQISREERRREYFKARVNYSEEEVSLLREIDAADRELADIEEKRIKAKREGELTKAKELELDSRREQVGKRKRDAEAKLTGGNSTDREALDSAMEKHGGVLGATYGLLGDNQKDALSKPLSSISNLLGKSVSVLSGISSGLQSITNTMDKAIDNATGYLAGVYGIVNANLDGTGKTFESVKSAMDAAVGATGFMKQTDYLSSIASLSNAGLNADIESRALLETVSKKTLTTFSAMDGSLTRLVRLTQQDISSSQFGLELQLKRVLNGVFQDTSYLNGLYDSVSSAIIDAGIATSSDLTEFNSTVQTWLGAMYESGLSDSVINSIASSINALGSGNINALSGSQDMQRLLLLSMDTVGLDYADILQQGLSSNDTNRLLSAMVSYLADIAGQTSDNLVLESAYGNLFNMSLSDMTAIQNLANSTKMSKYIINSTSAQALTEDAVTNMVKQNTLMSEYIDNAISNISFMFGSNMAENATLYTTYKTATFISDALGSFGDNKVINAIRLVPETVAVLSAIQPLYETLQDANIIGTLSGQNNLAGLLNSSGDVSTSASYYAKLAALATADAASNAFKSLTAEKTNSITAESIAASAEQWEMADSNKNETLEELQKITEVIMENSDGNKALAVSLMGMSNNVLRSFASIFADEDAMTDIFKAENKALSGALFDFADDETKTTTKSKK